MAITQIKKEQIRSVFASVIDGQVAIANGGTAANNSVDARINLGLQIGADIQPYDADLAEIAALNNASGHILYTNSTAEWKVAGPGAVSGVQAWDTQLDEIAALSPADGKFIIGDGTSFILEGTVDARASMGVSIGSDVQAWDADLDEIAAISNTAGQVLYTDGSAVWQAAAPGSTSGVQAWDAQLDDIAGLTPADGKFIIGDGTNFILEGTVDARASLGVSIGSDVQAWDADLDEIAAIANTAGQVLYTDGSAVWQAAAPGSTSGVQAHDAGLDSISGLSTTVDKMIYTTASDTYAVADFTSFARTLVDDANAAAARVTLGVEIGVDVQAYDAELAAIAALVSTADAIPMFSGSGSATLISLDSNVSLGSSNTAVPTQNAVKSYVDSVAQGLDIKESVRAATTANITLSGTQTIDGVALSIGDRVLVKDQTTGSQNGVYLVASGAWSRAGDFASGNAEAGAFMFVEEGTLYADTGWVCSSDAGSDVVGTNDLAFTQFSSAGVVIAGDGIDKSGNTLSADLKANGGLQIESGQIAINLSASNITGALANSYLVNSTISGVALGGTLFPVSASASGAISMSSYDGSTTVDNMSVNVDNSSIEINGSNNLQVKASGITDAMLSVDYIQATEVDNSSIEFAGGTLNVKALGVTNAMLAGSIQNAKLVNSTISGKALGSTLDALSVGASSGLSMSSYDGSAAVSNLQLDLDNLPNATLDAADSFAFIDSSDSGNPKRATVSEIAGIFSGGAGLTNSGSELSISIINSVVSGADASAVTFDGVSAKVFDSGDLGTTDNAVAFGQVYLNGILQAGIIQNNVAGLGSALTNTYDFVWDADSSELYFSAADIENDDIIQVFHAQ